MKYSEQMKQLAHAAGEHYLRLGIDSITARASQGFRTAEIEVPINCELDLIKYLEAEEFSISRTRTEQETFVVKIGW